MAMATVELERDLALEALETSHYNDVFASMTGWMIDQAGGFTPPEFDIDPGRVELANTDPVVESAVKHRLTGLLAGKLTVAGEVGGRDRLVRPEVEPVNMLTQLEQVARGDQEARRAARGNIKSLVLETTKHYGNAIEAEGHLDGQGRFWQYGQSSDAYLLNTFHREGPNILNVAEARDILRFEELVRHGRIKPHQEYTVVSLVPDGDRDELYRRGYFLESMSLVVRTLSLDGAGKVQIRSSFIAGVDMERMYAECGDGMSKQEIVRRQDYALAHRYDHDMVREFYARKGIELPANITAEELLDYGLIADKGDQFAVERQLDAIASRRLGKPRFFGTGNIGNYDTFIEDCKNRAAKYDEMTDAILDAAIEEISHHEWDPDDIPDLLRDLLKIELVDLILANGEDFTLSILGVDAPAALLAAQQAAMAGDLASYGQLRQRAIEVSHTGDCPTAALEKQLREVLGMLDISDEDKNDIFKLFMDEFGPLKFKCKKGHTNTRKPRQFKKNCKICDDSVGCK